MIMIDQNLEMGAKNHEFSGMINTAVKEFNYFNCIFSEML